MGGPDGARTGEARSRRELRLVLVALMTGTVLAGLDAMIVSTALPTIAGELGGLDHLSWVVTAYLLTSTAVVPIFGKLSDLFGRRPLFLVSVVIFLVGSVLSGLAQDMTQLIAARGLQGVGGGGLQALTFVILADVMSPRERARFIGTFTAVFAVTSVIGPLIGGVFTDALSWRWAFYVNLPVGAVTLYIASRYLPQPVPSERRQVDYAGAGLLLPAVTCLVLVSVWGGQEYAWGSPTIIGLVAAGVALTGLFVLRELRAPEALIPLHLFRIQAITMPTVISILLGAAMIGSMTFLPLYLQVVTGASATVSGLMMTPMIGGFVASTNTVGRLIAWSGRYKWFVVGGTAVSLGGVAILTLLDEHSGRLHVGTGMFLLGAGIGSSMPVLAVSVQNAAPEADLGAATSILNFFRSLGGAFGAAILGTLMTTRALGILGDSVDRRVLNSPAEIRLLPDELHDLAVRAISEGVALVFVVAGALVLAGFALTWLLRELPLRDDVAKLATSEGIEGLELALDEWEGRRTAQSA